MNPGVDESFHRPREDILKKRVKRNRLDTGQLRLMDIVRS
jgi:hypothetical protein